LDASGFVGAATVDLPRAGVIVSLFDRLAILLAERGVKLPKFGSGLISILKDQLVRFGHVFYLTKASPPLRIDLGGVCM
jgi:hypothetical protein